MTFEIKDYFETPIILEPRVELYTVYDFMGKELPGLAIVLDMPIQGADEKEQFRIKTYLQIISPQSAHILNNQGFYISCFNFFYQRLKARAIEIYTRKSVIGKMANVLKTIPTGIIFEVFLLIGNRITLASKVIIS